MNISLNRAAKLRNRLHEEVSELTTEISSTATITMNISIPESDISPLINQRQNDFISKILKYKSLSSILESIRTKIGSINSANGVDVLLTKRAALLANISAINTVLGDGYRRRARSGGTRSVDVQQVINQVKFLAERAKNTSAAMTDTINVSLLSVDIINQLTEMVFAWETEVEQIRSKIEQINATATISLTTDEVTALQDSKIAI